MTAKKRHRRDTGLAAFLSDLEDDQPDHLDAFELEMRIRNNQLKARRAQLGLNQDEMSKRIGIGKVTYYHYETLRASPRHAKSGEWKSSALAVAEFYKVSPEVLWPAIMQLVEKPVVVKTVNAETLAQLHAALVEERRALQQTPDEVFATKQLMAHVQQDMKDELNCRERTILEQRYLDGKTLGEVALYFTISRERARQIEGRAIGKLQRAAGRRRRKRDTWGD